MKMKNLSFTAVVIEDPAGVYAAFIEEITGVNSEGETLEEAKENFVEALKIVLETNKILA